MKKMAVLRGDPQENEVLTMPVAHDPRRARLVRRAHLKVADCSGIRSAAFRSIAALGAGIRKARGTQSLGIDAADTTLIEAISRGDRTPWLCSTPAITCGSTASLSASAVTQPWPRTSSATYSSTFGGKPRSSSRGPGLHLAIGDCAKQEFVGGQATLPRASRLRVDRNAGPGGRSRDLGAKNESKRGHPKRFVAAFAGSAGDH